MSSTTENYLKRIFVASESSPDGMVVLGEVAQALDVTPGTVTTMMKNLADAGLVDYLPRVGVRLTSAGRHEAVGVVRRHRLIELFLVETLGLDWSHVHEEAEVLEHVVSERLLARIDEILGHPTADPHGDPIPGPDGTIPEPSGLLLAEVDAPAVLEIDRVENEESAFLDFLKKNRLTPGTTVRLVEQNSDAETITVDAGGRLTTMSLQLARRIRVREAGRTDGGALTDRRSSRA